MSNLLAPWFLGGTAGGDKTNKSLQARACLLPEGVLNSRCFQIYQKHDPMCGFSISTFWVGETRHFHSSSLHSTCLEVGITHLFAAPFPFSWRKPEENICVAKSRWALTVLAFSSRHFWQEYETHCTGSLLPALQHGCRQDRSVKLLSTAWESTAETDWIWALWLSKDYNLMFSHTTAAVYPLNHRKFKTLPWTFTIHPSHSAYLASTFSAFRSKLLCYSPQACQIFTLRWGIFTVITLLSINIIFVLDAIAIWNSLFLFIFDPSVPNVMH